MDTLPGKDRVDNWKEFCIGMYLEKHSSYALRIRKSRSKRGEELPIGTPMFFSPCTSLIILNI